AVLQLQDRQVNRGRINLADAALTPTAVLRLIALQVIEHGLAEFGPLHRILLAREQLVVAFLTEDVHALREVVVLVFVVSETPLAEWDVLFAELDPLLGVLVAVIADAEGTGDSRG